jgi:hypothetical protein
MKKAIQECIEEIEKEKLIIKDKLERLEKIQSELKLIYTDREPGSIPGEAKASKRKGNSLSKVSGRSTRQSADAGTTHPKIVNKFYKNERGKWTREVFDFIKDNIKLKRKELVEKVNKKFGLNTTYGSLAFYMSREGINKKKILKKILKQKIKPMSNKQINNSLKDMHADDPEDPFDEEPPEELFEEDE